MKTSKILLIEDNYDNMTLMKFLLERKHGQVITALDGEEGLSKAYDQHPDLIVLDLDMPVMDGWEMMTKLKKDSHLKHIPILVVTAHLLPGERKKVLAAGGAGYISKPFKITDLLAEVDNCLS